MLRDVTHCLFVTKLVSAVGAFVTPCATLIIRQSPHYVLKLRTILTIRMTYVVIESDIGFLFWHGPAFRAFPDSPRQQTCPES